MTAPTTDPTAQAPQHDPAAQNDPVGALRSRIDQVDAELIRLWLERAEISKRVGEARMAAGGTRLVLSREQQIVDKFREALGTDGAQVAMLLLRAGRGPL